MERRLAAILAADVVGYSRLIGNDEAGTVTRLEDLKTGILDPLITEHRGRMVKVMGDGFIVEFASVVDALLCALAWQKAVESKSERVPEGQALRFRIGVNLGDVLVQADDLLGEGVNVAARLEGQAETGAVFVSGTVFDHAKGKVAASFEDLGERELKNIVEPVRVYRVSEGTEVAESRAAKPAKAKPPRLFLGAVASALLLALGVALWLKPWDPPEEPASLEAMAYPLPGKPSIAVLPFNNMSEDPSQDYFADGMTEDLITDLSKISGLFVIARNSSFSYKGRQVKLRQVAEELGVRYLLEGSVRRAGRDVRINAKLIDAITGGHLWAERYDGALDDIFDLQDRVAAQIVAALEVNLTDTEKEELEQRPRPVNLVAYEWLLKGRMLLAVQDRQNAAQAKTMFEKAIAADPSYARAYTNLGFYYWNQWRHWNQPKADNLEKALELGEKAARLDPKLAAAAVLLAVTYQYQGAHEQADTWADKALALDPTLAETLGNLGGYFRHANRYLEAVEVLEKAIRLDPLHPPTWRTWLGHAYLMSGNPQDALVVLTDAVAQDPGFPGTHVYLIATYVELGEIEKAIAHGKDILRLNKRFSVSAYERYIGSNTRNPDREKQIADALRKAGLPE